MASKEEKLYKIEFAVCDLLQQLCVEDDSKNLKLKAGDDELYEVIYSPNQLPKLARDLTVLSKVHELLSKDEQATKRDIFYDDKNVFGIQSSADRSITTACELLSVSRSQLNVTSCSRGLVQGALSFIGKEGDMVVDCRSSASPISEALCSLVPISNALFILVVEKDATFQRMIDQGFFKTLTRSILITGRGYPDLCSRHLLQYLHGKLAVPVLGLFDADPHGMEIYLTYKYGSAKDKFESNDAYVPAMRWLGVRRSDDRYVPVARDQLLRLSRLDHVKMRKLTLRARQLGEKDVIDELEVLRRTKTKIELEALTGGGGDASFLNECYLLPKIAKILDENETGGAFNFAS